MKPIYKYLLITLIAFALGVFMSMKFLKKEIVTETKYDTIVKTVIDSTGFRLINNPKIEVKPVTINVPKSSIEVTTLTDSVEVVTKKYKGKDTLGNGIIDWEVYADKMYARNFKLTVNEKTITKTVTQTLPSRSRLFLLTGTEFNTVNKLPNELEVGLMYNYRQKWGVGFSFNHDFTGKLPSADRNTLGVKVLIGL